ncbi:MAG: hypothetical protein II979_04055 [Clostridia bacterium]|nr:hypothetical protein [Clostridia bacterium]
MKKLLLGISMILFGIALCLLAELTHVYFLRNNFGELLCFILPCAGAGISIWGFLEKDE